MRSSQSRRKAIFFLILLLMSYIPIFPFSSIPGVRAQGANWLTGWTYRRPITINGSSAGTQTDYQIKVALSLIDEYPENNASFLTTPTHDGGGQAVHPSIYYNASGWNGYTYWMAYCPYPAGDATKETPNIVASNNGTGWEIPPGIDWPIVIEPGVGGDPQSDPNLVYNSSNGELLLYYRRNNVTHDHIYLKSSSDGLDWGGNASLGTMVLVEARVGGLGPLMSPSVQIINGTYFMWSVDRVPNPNTIELRNSSDGITWNASETVTIDGTIPGGLSPWHVEVQYIANVSQYWALLTVCPEPNSGAGSVLAFLGSAELNKTEFYVLPDLFMDVGVGGNWDDGILYKPTFVYNETTRLIEIWYSAQDGANWHIGKAEATITEYSDLFTSFLQNDGDDIRVTDYDGDTLLPHWTEDYGGIEITEWALVPSIPATGTTIYMYYGHATANSTSNGNTTFPQLFDTFDGATLNLTIWDEVDATGSYQIAGGVIKVQGADPNLKEIIHTDTDFPPNVAMRARASLDETTGNFQITYIGFRDMPTSNPRAVIMSIGGVDNCVTVDNLANVDNDAFTQVGAYYDFDIIRNGTTRAEYYAGGVLIANGDADPSPESLPVEMYVRDTEDDLYVDWVLIRKFVSPEPVFNTFGAEETLSGGSSNSAPVLGAYTISDWDGEALYADASSLYYWWLQATDADGGSDIATYEFAFQLGTVWCNFTFTTSTGLWTKDTESPITIYTDGQSSIGTTKNILGFLTIGTSADPTDNVVVYGRVTDASSATSGWGVLAGPSFNVWEEPGSSGDTGGYSDPGDDDEEEAPPDGPGDPYWWTDPDNLDDLSDEELEALADSLDIPFDDDTTRDELIQDILDLGDDPDFIPFSGCGMDDEEKLAKLEYLMGLSVQELRLECDALGISYRLWRTKEPYVILIFTVGYGCSVPDEFFDSGFWDPEDWDGDGTENWDDPDMFDDTRMGMNARIDDIHLEESLPWVQNNGYMLIILLLVFAFFYSQVKKKDQPGSRGESLIRPKQGGYLPGERKK